MGCTTCMFKMAERETYMALGFQTHEDFEICKDRMNIRAENVAVSGDAMVTVLVKTENVIIPHGTLVVTTNRGRRIFIRVTSGRSVN